MNIDTNLLQSELQEVAGTNVKVAVKVNSHHCTALSITEHDRNYYGKLQPALDVVLNPKRIRNQHQLDYILGECRRAAVGDYY